MVDCTFEALQLKSVKWRRFAPRDLAACLRASRRHLPHCIDQRITSYIFHYYYIPNIFFNMPVRLISLPAVVRSQVFETCLSKRSFSISSKVSGHENPLVSGF